MPFVMLIYQGTAPLPGSEAWAAMPDEDQQAVYADYAALQEVPGLTSGLPLGRAADARTVQVVDGVTVSHPGPRHGADGAVGGWFVLDADDIDTAIELARRVPAARLGGAVEIRPVATYW